MTYQIWIWYSAEKSKEGQEVEFEACNLSGFPDWRETAHTLDTNFFFLVISPEDELA